MKKQSKPAKKTTVKRHALVSEHACINLEHMEGDRWQCVECGKLHIVSATDCYEGEDE